MNSQRGSELLVYDCYKYYKGRLMNVGQIWRCVKKNICKTFDTDDISKRPAKLVRQEIQTAPEFVRENLKRKDLQLERRSCYKAIRSIYPPLPKNIQEVHDSLENINMCCANGDNILLVNDRANNIVIFGAVKNLEFLCSLLKIHMDD